KNFLPQNCFLKNIQVYNSSGTNVFRRSVKSLKSNDVNTYAFKYDSGLVMTVNNTKLDSLEVYLKTNEIFRSKNKNLIYLFIQTHGNINHLSTEKTKAEITRISIPKKTLSPGINQITIFDSEGPVCERYIYIYSEIPKPLNVISIDSCNKRNRVTLEVQICDTSTIINNETNLSVSVSIETNEHEITDINDYLVFGTEFGILPYSKIEGRKIAQLPHEIMDSLLLTIKSNWINWEKIFSNDELILKYPFEEKNHYLSGTLLNSKYLPVGADEIILMSEPLKPSEFQYTKTNKAGNFNVLLNINEDINDFIIQPDILSTGQIVYIESSFPDQYIKNEIFLDSIKKLTTPFLTRQNMNYQVRKVFGTSTLGERIPANLPIIKTKRFYGKPDIEIDLKNYIKLDSMQEVFFELVPQVALERVNSKYELSIIDQTRKKIEGTPCVMIDGVIIKDLSVIANLDPKYVDKIHVVNSKYRVGGYLFNGIINIISQSGVFNDTFLPADAIKLHYNVIDTICSFVSPDYSSEEKFSSPIADFRNTLYWNPSIKTDNNGKATIEFWTSDIKSDYIINIQGIISSGQSVSYRKHIKIK
ncbi:MAG: hypothetical protein ACM3RX_03790, partial [Methanococcaceae archaeon]